jgi:ubiquinone/menaquinone biosynthesis C-methylase UbiE
MKTTDYSIIAENYDKNKNRYGFQKDDNIGELYGSNNVDFTVLDLSCGTGNYLERQIIEYPISKYRIKWIGIDKSEDMMRKAQAKNLNADLIIADVVNIPLEDNSVDYIKTGSRFTIISKKKKPQRKCTGY